ncbi:predicted protein [Lichtheimia corymbifera JMRC:FSU:9682]|uniref:Uncharacterized protein n=1 Tax=Lichtheimia corymbifera JMRC:FSU:9682 TaxID=1263082 RepID=A0A068RTK7_9FUNG|nr:predicted protein [Lichtheimia corymbifera JMRC:FSU:9682]
MPSPPVTSSTNAVEISSMSFVLQPHDHIDSWSRVIDAVLEQVDHQSDENTVFERMIRVLEIQYERRIDNTRQQVQQLHGTIAGIERHQRQLDQERSAVERTLHEHEQRLPVAQQLAVVRQHKRAQQRRRYDRMHWIPVVSSRCRKSYMHAMNKHAAAEHELANLRVAIDHTRRARQHIAQTLANLNAQSMDTRQQAAVLEQRLKALDSTIAALIERRRFWHAFELNQARLVRESARMLILSNVDNEIDDDDNNDEWTKKTFQMACFEYAECIRHGKEHLANPPGQYIEFECARCLKLVQQQTWPMWMGRHDLVCQHCYQAPAKSNSKKTKAQCNMNDNTPCIKQITVHVPWKQKLIRFFWHRLAKAIKRRI